MDYNCEFVMWRKHQASILFTSRFATFRLQKETLLKLQSATTKEERQVFNGSILMPV